MDKTCAKRVVPLSVGENTLERKKKQVLCIFNFHRLDWALAGNPLDYSSYK